MNLTTPQKRALVFLAEDTAVRPSGPAWRTYRGLAAKRLAYFLDGAYHPTPLGTRVAKAVAAVRDAVQAAVKAEAAAATTPLGDPSRGAAYRDYGTALGLRDNAERALRELLQGVR